MRILHVASEAAPFAKTGGLGDVAGALPAAQAAAGARVVRILPLYASCREAGIPLEPTPHEVRVALGGETVGGRLWRAVRAERRRGPPAGDLETYLIENDRFYRRAGLYGAGHEAYPDNAARFLFLSRAALEAAKAVGGRFDVVHVHDWQAALIPACLKTTHAADPVLGGAKSVLTIHNLGYQGNFPAGDMPLTGLPAELFNWKQFEFWGRLNLLKGGIVFADALTTVSPGYAAEIRTEAFGHGLDGVLRERAGALRGILNGIDERTWDPASDPHLPARFDGKNLAGKAACRRVLLERAGLPSEPDLPVAGIVSRFADQKGLDVVAAAADTLLDLGLRLVVLGDGDPGLRDFFLGLAARRPDRVAVRVGYDEPMAHLIEAGADLFLMASRYEPCGLNQMYSQRYGTAPVVHRTGGLADTVVDATPEALRDGTATGFLFAPVAPGPLVDAVRRALALRRDDPAAWRALQRAGMRKDWSWSRSAREYLALYAELTGKPAAAASGKGRHPAGKRKNNVKTSARR